MKTGFVIYVHTNRLNNKRYVGWAKWTKGTPHDAMTRRWRGHCYDAQHDSELLFHKAIRKYGVDSWTHEVLDVVATKKTAKHIEMLWITQRRSFVCDHPDTGYNMTRGGEGTFEWQPSNVIRQRMSKAGKGKHKRQPPRSAEHQRKLNEAARNRKPVSDETRQRLSKALQGNQNTKGHTLSEEHKRKLSESFSGERNHQWGKPSPNRGKKLGPRRTKCGDCGGDNHNKRTCPITNPENHLKRQLRLRHES